LLPFDHLSNSVFSEPEKQILLAVIPAPELAAPRFALR
jgi:hypothetical protein